MSSVQRCQLNITHVFPFKKKPILEINKIYIIYLKNKIFEFIFSKSLMIKSLIKI